MSKSVNEFDDRDMYVLGFTLERLGDLQMVKGRVHISDALSISFDQADGTYMACNLDGSEDWVGVDTDKNRAILKYLMKRLGIQKEPTDER